MPTGTDGFPWWNDTVFYEVFVRSFYDSDGDGVGDFNGLTAKLDYLNDGDPQTDADLGVTGLWLMPIHPAMSYHGYNVTDYYQINSQYGTLDDFKRFLAEAHQRGIRVLIDWVPNHTSNAHPWFLAALDPQSEYHDCYIWSDEQHGEDGRQVPDALSEENLDEHNRIGRENVADHQRGDEKRNDAIAPSPCDDCGGEQGDRYRDAEQDIAIDRACRKAHGVDRVLDAERLGIQGSGPVHAPQLQRAQRVLPYRRIDEHVDGFRRGG